MPPQVVASRTAAAATGNAGGKAQATPAAVPSSNVTEKLGAHGAKVKHKRRFCRIEGCEKIVKSQGLCQRHGAKPRLCKVKDCTKQAQGNFDGMCKSHFKEHKRKTTPIPKVDESMSGPPQPIGSSVFESILPASVDFFPGTLTVKSKMPLVAHLAEGFHGGKPPAWHRNEERQARGLLPVQNPATQLEGWERELVWMEILVLTGVPEVSFRHLARAWGRDKGFHMVLAQFICERHGDVQRKKRKREDELSSNDAQKRPAFVDAQQHAVAPKMVPRTQQEQQQQLVRLGMSPEEAKTINLAMLSPEKKKRIATLLRRRSSENKDKQAGGTELTDEQLALIGADVWDETCYGDSNYNEALAADLFNLTPQDSAILMRRLSVGRQAATAAADDDSSIYSRSVASGKTLGLQSRGGSTDQQAVSRLPKRDSSASLMSNHSAQIPNTVAVKKTPEGRANDQQFELSFSAEEGAKPAATSPWPHPSQQQQQQQQQYNGETAQQAKDNLQGSGPQQNSQLISSKLEYHANVPHAAATQTYQAHQQSTQLAQPGQAQYSNGNESTDTQLAHAGQFEDAASTRFGYNHQGFRAQSNQGQEQQSNLAHANYNSNAPPQVPEQHQGSYHQHGSQQYQPAPQQQPTVQQQYQPPSQPQSYQPPRSPPQQTQQYQSTSQHPGQLYQQYGQSGQPAQTTSPQLLPQQQVQHSHQAHQHEPTQGQSMHQRQGSYNTSEVFPQPHSRQNSFSAQGHPLLSNQSSGQGFQHNHHPQSLHQRQRSQQNIPQHGAPQVSTAYQQQQGTNEQNSGGPQAQSFHHRQHSLQRHLLQGQTQVFHSQLPPVPAPGPPHHGQFGAQPDSQHMHSNQTQQHQQVIGYGGQQPQSNQQYHPLSGRQQSMAGGGAHTTQHENLSYTASRGPNQDGGHPLLRGMPQMRPQIGKPSPDLHEYDHRNEHLEAEEDDHTDEDDRHRHDYGAEVEVEEHDHEDTQRQPAPSTQSHSYEQRPQEPIAGYTYHQPGQQHGHAGQGQDTNAPYGQAPQQWNQAPPGAAAYGNHPSSGTQVQQGGHHHQHDHLGQSHHMDPPPQRVVQPGYANLNSVPQASVQTHYQGMAQQGQQYREAQYSGSTLQPQHDTFQSSQGYQQAAPSYGQQQQNPAHSSMTGFQASANQSSQASHHHGQYPNQQHSDQGQGQNHSGPQSHQGFDQYAGPSTAGYQSHGGSEGTANNAFHNSAPVPTHQRHPSQQGHEDTQTMMNAFQQEPVQYHQQQSGNSAFHHQTQPGGQGEQNSYSHSYDSQQSSQHQPPQYQEQTQHDHEATKKAMAGFEQDQQQHGHSSANGAEEENEPDPLDELLEMPYTQQQPSDGQQQGTYQQETQNSGRAYSQGAEDQSSSHHFEQQSQGQNSEGHYQQQQEQNNQEHYQQQHQGPSNQEHYHQQHQGQSNEDEYQQQQEGQGSQDQYSMLNSEGLG